MSLQYNEVYFQAELIADTYFFGLEVYNKHKPECLRNIHVQDIQSTIINQLQHASKHALTMVKLLLAYCLIINLKALKISSTLKLKRQHEQTVMTWTLRYLDREDFDRHRLVEQLSLPDAAEATSSLDL